MAIIYTLDYDLKVKSYLKLENRAEFRNDEVYITSNMLIDEHAFNEFKKDFPYSDTYHSIAKFVYADIHTHSDKEMRFIVKGEALFYLPYEDYLVVAMTGPGDLIILEPNVQHWFSAYGEVSAIRFFSKNNGHIMNSVEVDDIIQTAHQQLSYGFKINF